VLALDPAVVDTVWAAVCPILPNRPPDTHPLGCHRRRIPDRACFEGILVRLVTGCSWDVAGRLGKGGETTLRSRRDSGSRPACSTASATKPSPPTAASSAWTWRRSPSRGACTRPPVAGRGPGPIPATVPRAAGSGWRPPTRGHPHGWTIDAANRTDSKLISTTLQAVAARGPVDDIATLHLDRVYDNHLVERVCEGFGITDVVCANGLPWPSFGCPTERHPLQPLDQVLVPSLTRCLYPSTLPPPMTAPRP